MGAFNLIHEQWLPILRASGRSARIAPWQVVDGIGSDPVVAFDWPRADFNGAALEFLIGLLATACPPKDEEGWIELWEVPPAPEMLRSAFDAIAHAFDVDGEGARFLQDIDPLADAEPVDIGALLIDQPGGQTLRLNKDHFVKRGGVSVMARATAAMALYTLQTYAPSGGQGHRTSMRGGGPLITLIAPDRAGQPETLWHLLWANVEERRRPAAASDAPAVFPWLAPTLTSEKDKVVTTDNAHILQAHWGMPRRIRLVFEPAEGRICNLTGQPDPVVVTAFRMKNFGVNYIGWEHPLTPYARAKLSEMPNPMKSNPGGVSYRHWLGLVQEDAENGRNPAACVTRFRRERAQICNDLAGIRLLAFGYDMDNMKARSWYQSEIPVPQVDPARRMDFEIVAARLVRGADMAAALTRSYAKRALFSRPADTPGSFSLPGDRFWGATEADFFALLHDLAGGAEETSVCDRWHDILRRTALGVFDEAVPTRGIENGAWQRVVTSRRALSHMLNGDKLRGELGLAPLERKAGRKKGAVA